jgi:hypothetical protein
VHIRKRFVVTDSEVLVNLTHVRLHDKELEKNDIDYLLNRTQDELNNREESFLLSSEESIIDKYFFPDVECRSY